MKILIIDDDEIVRMSCSNVLKKEGYEIFEAESGAEGVETFKSQKPDLVITDILMPEKEGLETITDIRAITPGVKILAISSGGNTQNLSFLKLAKKMGADKAVQKPLKPAELTAVTRELLQGK